MGSPTPGRSGQGPLGTRTNRPTSDKGTNNLQRSIAPADRHALVVVPVNASAKKIEYLSLAYATSHAMQGKSAGQRALALGEGAADWVREKTGGHPSGKSRTVQSFLGGAFLRMYLDGKVDPDVVAAAGEEIGEAREFGVLTADLQGHLQTMVTAQKLHEITTDGLKSAAYRHLDAKRRSKSGIAFRHTLNTVIGGITGIDVEEVKLLEEVQSTTGMTRKYQIGIILRDIYDFENKRSGEYDRYRKKLAALLIAGKFAEFEDGFFGEAIPFSQTRRTKLDDATVFASFMYALEKKRWTPGGLSWQVTVPAEISLHFAAAGKKPPVRKP
jgi:hypothetical protein